MPNFVTVMLFLLVRNLFFRVNAQVLNQIDLLFSHEKSPSHLFPWPNTNNQSAMDPQVDLV